MSGDTDTDEPVLLGTIDVSAAGGRPKLLLGDLTGDGRMDLLLVQGDDIDAQYDPHQVQSLTAFDLDGELLWQVGEPDPRGGSHGADFPAQIWDFDGDGRNEVVCVMDGRFIVIEGRTGTITRKHELPDPQAHDCIVPADLSGDGYRGDLLVKDRYSQVWALNNDFDLLWTHRGNTGHYPWVFDFDQDGSEEVMAGYDFLASDGTVQWSTEGLDEHADCIWVADIHNNGEPTIVIGEGGLYAYDQHGTEHWRNQTPREVQHIAPGKYRNDTPGLQIAGLDRIVRGSSEQTGQDGIFLVDHEGTLLCEENREPGGWLTIIEPMTKWDDGELDYILAWRRGGGTNPTLYDGYLNSVVTFPVDGHVVHGDLFGAGNEQVVILDEGTVHVFGNEKTDLSEIPQNGSLSQPKRLANSTLYPGGELALDHHSD
jgi:hypothetical protein